MSTIPGLAPLTIAGVSTTDGRGVVPQTLLLAPLTVRIPMWEPTPAPGDEPHILRLFWSSHDGVRLLATQTVTAPPPPVPAFHELTIQLADLRSATRIAQLYYTVNTEGGSNLMRPSIPITLDLEPPRLVSPTDTLRFVVPPVPALNNQYLLNNPRPAFYVPVYNIGAEGDRIEIYLSNSPNPAPGLAAAGTSLVDFTTSPWTVSLNGDAFRSLNDGPAYVFFKIFDATGNFSNRSIGLPFTVSLGATVPIPTISLPAPIVQHTRTGASYLSCGSVPSVMAGVSWLIRPVNTLQLGDEVRCVWQGYNDNNWFAPNTSVVFRRSLLWAPQHITAGAIVVVDSFDTTLRPLRDFRSAIFTYEVWRNGVKVGESLEGRVRVDLTYPTGGFCSPRGLEH
ncbi:hypothetical protein [Pseudomonas sp.]|uniref:hypothetical protein n=1 Tax=Pseudomonas sp. TaxID=306 RepID=UPI003C5E3471